MRPEEHPADAPRLLDGLGTATVYEAAGEGIVVVAAERVEEVAQAARAREEKESRLRPSLRAGELTYDLLGLRAKEEEGR